jgi:hypothetical protein
MDESYVTIEEGRNELIRRFQEKSGLVVRIRHYDAPDAALPVGRDSADEPAARNRAGPVRVRAAAGG